MNFYVAIGMVGLCLTMAGLFASGTQAEITDKSRTVQYTCAANSFCIYNRVTGRKEIGYAEARCILPPSPSGNTVSEVVNAMEEIGYYAVYTSGT